MIAMYGELYATDKLNEFDETEVASKILDRWLEECMEHFQKLTAEERAYKIIHNYFELENLTDEMHDRFTDWFFNDLNRAAKNRAMERMFIDYLIAGGNGKHEIWNRGVKAEDFEQRICRLYSDETPESEQDTIRVWLAGDEDAELKRDVLCKVMLSVFGSHTGLDTGPKEKNPLWPTNK